MTTPTTMDALVPLVADLARELPEGERYRRLLHGLRQLIPCDAIALLRLEGERLQALAVEGLSADTLGRQFLPAEHPRLQALLNAPGPLRFDADCELPDPYDGLVEHQTGPLPVHDCAGCAVKLDGQLWGMLTVDALSVGRFDGIELSALQAFAELAAATVSVIRRMEALAVRAEQERRRAEGYREAAVAARVPRRLLGQSKPFKALLQEIELVAASELPVLIHGETGVGKELVAQALHERSARAAQPMVSVNCAALPDTLVESELFGHVRGAFTGAHGDRRGKFELAHGSTLFLDEVAELPLLVQAKLLRVLQSGELQRLGSDRPHRVDVRLVAASNRKLADEVKAGRMRADFYHRLSVFPLQVPPLRERGRDVLLLAGFCLEENRSRLGLGSLRLEADAQAALLAYGWPGNVRELEHVIARAALRALSRQPNRPRILGVAAEDLDLPIAAFEPVAAQASSTGPGTEISPVANWRDAVDEFQRRLLQTTLTSHGGRPAAAARALGLDRANLARLAKRLGVATSAGG
ncbi:nitric oxide reductase transcriptional regulator NorR [Ideonella azotifigens]|uniref:Nitric oxide reductase transcriptional regulator NorR n=2 Tax=Ideonella azotifigens TaxID=513160 RepID=A0ABP3V1Q8_9BURK|nr:nitric oxide reductase transcriptional regulator NorR [Ideonella azotifigens]MCD2341030.1 nitric oxide reductase transcriptional regulator NorR [Ideonella azotifigens]